jgi:hypothetical protein
MLRVSDGRCGPDSLPVIGRRYREEARSSIPESIGRELRARHAGRGPLKRKADAARRRVNAYRDKAQRAPSEAFCHALPHICEDRRPGKAWHDESTAFRPTNTCCSCAKAAPLGAASNVPAGRVQTQGSVAAEHGDPRTPRSCDRHGDNVISTRLTQARRSSNSTNGLAARGPSPLSWTGFLLAPPQRRARASRFRPSSS